MGSRRVHNKRFCLFSILSYYPLLTTQQKFSKTVAKVYTIINTDVATILVHRVFLKTEDIRILIPDDPQLQSARSIM